MRRGDRSFKTKREAEADGPKKGTVGDGEQGESSMRSTERGWDEEV